MSNTNKATQPKPTTVPEETTVELAPHKRLLVFSSPACGPCRQLKSTLEKINQKEPLAYEITSYDDSTKSLFEKFGVRNVPALVHVDVTYNDKGEPQFDKIDQAIGFEGETALRATLEAWGYLG